MKQATKHVMGKSIEGRELVVYELRVGVVPALPISKATEFQSSRAPGFKGTKVPGEERCILIFGGFHGDEPKSVHVVQRLIEEFHARHERNTEIPKRRNAETITKLRNSVIAKSVRWVLMPVVNPDGYERRARRNARGVDINRNFPTKNWEVGSPRSRMFGGCEPASEPETRAVMRVIEKFRPDAIITVHSINRDRFCNNFDGPGRELARQLSRYNKYPVTSTIGYPTPGSFGTWAGVERGIPTITLELPSHHSSKRCWEENREALLSFES